MVYESLKDLFAGICDAIRNKDGSVGMIEHQNIPDRILELKAANGGTAVAQDIRSGKSAYVNGELVEGSLVENSSRVFDDSIVTVDIFERESTFTFQAQNQRDSILKEHAYVQLLINRNRFGNAKPENVDVGVKFTSSEGVTMTGTRPTTGGNSTDLSDIGKLHFWEKYNSNPVGGYVENEPTSVSLRVANTFAGTTTSSPIYYGDTFEFDEENKKFNVDSIGYCTTLENAKANLPGKYIRHNTEYGYLYYVHEEATITENTTSTMGTARYIVISKASKITAGVSKVIGYAAAEESETYPENGKHVDGYWYVYRGLLADALGQ